MTAFDVFTLLLLGLSAVVGFARGAVRELVGLFALILSTLATLLLLPFIAPFVRSLIHPGWVAAVVAAVGLFVLTFVILQLLAGALTSTLDRQRLLGGANRLAGLGFGLVRGAVVLGLLFLLFTRAAPARLQPEWITGAATYPVARGAARALQTVFPKGLHLPGGLPALGAAVGAAAGDSKSAVSADGDADPSPVREQPFRPDGAGGAEADDSPSADPPQEAPLRSPSFRRRVKSADHGYTRRARDSVDALVEHAR